MAQSADFSLRALYEALDAQRAAGGLTWTQVTREINRESERLSVRPVSPSTVTSTRTRAVAEADGVLQMLLWLERTPESFVVGHPAPDETRARLPRVPSSQILRFDTLKLHAALDAQRTRRDLTWTRVGQEIGVAAASLTRLSNGGRTVFPHVMRIVRWLEQPAARFTRGAVSRSFRPPFWGHFLKFQAGGVWFPRGAGRGWMAEPRVRNSFSAQTNQSRMQIACGPFI